MSETTHQILRSEVEVEYGAVTYSNEVEAVPPSSRREGNVTVNVTGSPGIPAYFQVSFMLSTETEVDGLTVRNIFHLNSVVAGLPRDAPYSQVETAAFERLAPMLRAFAQSLDDQAKAADEARGSGTT